MRRVCLNREPFSVNEGMSQGMLIGALLKIAKRRSLLRWIGAISSRDETPMAAVSVKYEQALY